MRRMVYVGLSRLCAVTSISKQRWWCSSLACTSCRLQIGACCRWMVRVSLGVILGVRFGGFLSTQQQVSEHPLLSVLQAVLLSVLQAVLLSVLLSAMAQVLNMPEAVQESSDYVPLRVKADLYFRVTLTHRGSQMQLRNC